MSAGSTSWSRRRAAVAAEAAAEEKAAADALIVAEQAELADKSDAEILEQLGLPDPETLVQGDDFKAFMAKTVPAHLRKQALRKLWRSNPVLACVDGLNDYDDDYLKGSVGQGAIKTTYQVGKGMLAHLVEMERQKAAALLPAVKDDLADDIAEQEVVAVAEPDTHEADVTAEPVDAKHMPTPRRMRFQFTEETL